MDRALQFAGAMVRCLVLPVVLAASPVAAAPLAVAAGDSALVLESVASYVEETPGPPLRYGSFVQLTGGSGGGDLGAGGAVRVAGLGCEILNASVQGRARASATETFAGNLDYSFCLSRVALSFTMSGNHAVGIAPAIDARRSLWSRRYDHKYDRITIAGGELWRGMEGGRTGSFRHTILELGIGHGATHQNDVETQRAIKQLDLDITLWRVRRLEPVREYLLEVLVVDTAAMKSRDDDLGGIATELLPVRLGFQGEHVFARAGAGWGFKGSQLTIGGTTEVDGKTTSFTETIDSTGLPDVRVMVGELTAGVKSRRLSASAGVKRSLYPTFDGNLAYEERASGSVTASFGRRRPLAVTISPFAARTRTFDRDAAQTEDLTAGATLHVGRELNRRLRLDAIGEAGRSPYLKTDGPRLQSSNGGQLLVALSAYAAR
ncbi:MAG: hypothetical protein ABI867_33270 [Kofleriaceae bacterium]